MRRILLAAVAALAITGAAHAATADQQFYIMGEPGMMTCSELTSKLSDQQAGVMLGTWLGGYVTALNRNMPDTFNVIGGVTLEDFFNSIIAACAASPDSHVESAVHVAIEKALPSRQTTVP